MTRFVSCIDLHNGQVKQIVGATLTDNASDAPTTNFVSQHSAGHYARLYREHNVSGCHVIKLGPNNDAAALEALRAAPGFLQVGGGINYDNCLDWLRDASKIILTSWLFDSQGHFQLDRLQKISERCGKHRLVVDLSCRRVQHPDGRTQWIVAMNKWQKLTDLELSADTFRALSAYTQEFLIHAADVEGLCRGIDESLVENLYNWTCDLPDLKIVYAGGAKSVQDLALVHKLSHGKVDLTYGSALDIFGGNLVNFADCCKWNETH